MTAASRDPDATAGWATSSVCVCILATGNPQYAVIAERSIGSVLEYSPFTVLYATDRKSEFEKFLQNGRVQTALLPPLPDDSDRSNGFLRKFDALAAALELSPSAWFMMLDADAMLTSPMGESDIAQALGEFGFGMVEQTTITGSAMSRSDFLGHYTQHTMAWFGHTGPPPSIEEFRYFNAGVLIAKRSELEEIVSWARNVILSSRKTHDSSGEMIGDQDYFQYWANTLHRGSCATLPWYWNHCEHWDDGFPHPDAKIVHLSNFCHGPNESTPNRMSELREKYRNKGARCDFRT